MFDKIRSWRAKRILDATPAPVPPPEEPVEHGISTVSPATFAMSVKQQTEQVRGGGGMGYNPEITPYQHWLLSKHHSPTTQMSSVREDLFHSSQLLKKHARDMIWRIVASGWSYEREGQKVFKDLKWSPDLQDAYIDALAKAMVIDTTFLLRWAGGDFSVFTRNNITGNVYVSREARRIKEVYFNYPRLDNAVYDDTNAMNDQIIGVLTQYSDQPDKKARMGGKESIYRDCVMFQPYPDVNTVYGRPYLEVENDTGLQKIYLRSYEFAFIHKGGVNQVIAIPNQGSKRDFKDQVVRNVSCGILSRGLVMDVQLGSKSINELILTKDTAIPELGFDRINSMISEDAQLSKQRIEGTAETGALGGEAPVVNQQQDLIQLDSLLIIMDKSIRDVNEVFFGIKAYKEEKMSIDGETNVMKMPAYDIVFMQPIEMVEEAGSEDGVDQGGRPPASDKITPSARGPQRRPAAEIARPTNPSMGISSSPRNSGTGVAHASLVSHAVELNGQQYAVYEGNLFDAIPYYYPESNTFEDYTTEDIEAFASNPVNRAPIAFMHGDSVEDVGMGKNLGFLEVMGYDAGHKRDRTRFYIPEADDARLRADGVIVDDTIKVSPLFHRRVDERGQKHIYLKNGAIIDPRKARPRAELTGGSTQATKVE